MVFKALLDSLGSRVESTLKHAVSPLAPYLRRLLVGVGLAIIGIHALVVSLVFMAIALFWEFAGQPKYTAASLYTALIIALFATSISFWARTFLRQPRP